MKTIFSTCPYSQARTNEFFTLANQVLQAAETMLAGKTEAQSMIAAYKTPVEAFDAALKQSAKNSYTASVEMADEAVDQTWSDMWAMTKAMVRHPNLERRKASAAVYDLMQKYGNVTSLSYKEEYGRLKNLSQDLEALGTEQLGLAYVDEWFEELKKRIATYETAEAGRLAEEDARQVGLDQLVPVVGNGTAIPGTELDCISPAVHTLLTQADLIISKGQGNFETLHGCGLNIYYLFLCKCDYFVRKFQMERFQGVFTKESLLTP